VGAIVRLSVRLWREYSRRKKAEDTLRRKREQLIVDHLELASTIARNVWRRFTRTGQGGYGSRIDYEDMVSCARVGLVEAAGRWDPSLGDFPKYCYLRVRGAVIDAYRRQNYTESLHESVDQWFDNAETRAGTNDQQIAAKNDIAKYMADPRPLPDELVDQVQRAEVLEAVVDRVLPDDERDVLRSALHGSSVADIAAKRGQPSTWARTKLAEARDKVAREVQRRAA
jgi:RNA polymerase sigma factor (sigma-70 family)